MGQPSNKRRSARRPGPSERKRVKKKRRTRVFRIVPSAESALDIKYGRRKSRRVFAFLNRPILW